MNSFDRLNSYLRHLEGRLRWMTVSRGAAALACLALAITVALVMVTNAYAFSPGSLLWARVVLFLSLALAIGFGLVGPILQLNRKRAARRAEQIYPEFQERLLTIVERSEADPNNPFLALVASDAASIADQTEQERFAPRRKLFGWLASAGAAAGVLLWLILAGPGYFGYGAALLWAGAPKVGFQPFYDIQVKPGNMTVRKRADQLVTAMPIGFQPAKVLLLAKYGGASKWEEAAMQPQPQGSGFEFLFAGLAETVQYYIEAGAVKSAVYTLKVVDLPAVKKIRVTYHFPSWSGMPDATEDPGGDLRAVEGTIAEVNVETDRPLTSGVIVLDDDKQQIKLEAAGGNHVTAKIPIEKDGVYHFAAIDRGQPVRLSEDYFIEARKDSPPTVRLTRPGRDAKVNPVAEVTMAAEAEDDFGLQSLELHYTVNGGDEKTVSLLNSKGVKKADGKLMIALEDYKLSPGDVVSYYATAKDARTTSKTDIFFIEATPYEFEYSQAQSGGGGGGGGGQQDELHVSERQKEIMAATWNQLKGSPKSARQSADDAKFLAEVQGKLRDQSKTLVERMKSRQLSGTNQEFQSFSKDMEEAAKLMDQAVEKLKKQQWKEALTPEQKALQQELRAEATFRQIQVAFGNKGGGGGGGGASRDLENLFDLELDTEKNQYETGQQSASNDQQQREIDEALQKLKELAKRQQELADRENQNKQNFQQRWEQEMLRREAEQLQKQLEQLTRNSQSQQQSSQSQQGQQGQQGQQSQQQSQGQSQGQSSSQSSRGGQSGQSGSSQQRLEDALKRLQQATEDMRKAAQSAAQQSSAQQAGQQGRQFGQQSQADARRAAERMKEAQDLLGGLQHQQAAQQLDDLAQRSEKLAAQQSDFADRLKKEFGDRAFDPRNPRGNGGMQPGASQQKAGEMADEKMKMLQELEQIEKEMQKTVRDMAAAQPGVSSKLREALGNEQQQELKLRMKFNSEAIRQGQGALISGRETPVTQGLAQLRDGIKQAQGALSGTDPKQQPGGAGNDELQKALQRVEQLRQQMQQLAQGGQQGHDGQRPGQGPQDEASQRLSRMAKGPEGQQGQQGQQAGQQPGQGQQGQQAGQQPGQGQQGQQPGEQQGQGQQGGQQGGQQARGGTGGPRGGGGPAIGSFGGYDVQRAGETYRDALRDLTQLRGTIGTNPEFARDINDLIGAIRQYDPNRIGDPDLLRDRITHAVLPGLEELELELRRKVDESQSGQVRSSGAEAIPSGYAEAVAEYFRKLSKSK